MADPQDAYNVRVPAFEGPLDLLLHLIKQNKVDIYDIPIALITRQYLQYIEIMKELNLEIASEFIVMAATLIYIKSRMLLPPDESIETAEEEDPRASLVQRLLEYQSFKEASETLRERESKWHNAFSRAPLQKDESAQEPELYLFEVNLFDLVGALKRVLSKAPMETLAITRELLTVKDKIALILEQLESTRTLRFDDLFKDDRTRVQVIVTFLALLELLKLGALRCYQTEEFGAIWLVMHAAEAEGETLTEPAPSSGV
jgi:segregation and condensation protein A